MAVARARATRWEAENYYLVHPKNYLFNISKFGVRCASILSKMELSGRDQIIRETRGGAGWGLNWVGDGSAMARACELGARAMTPGSV